MSYHRRAVLVAVGIWLVVGMAPAGAQTREPIGLFTTVRGDVQVTRVALPSPKQARLRDDVYFKDIIETQAGARAKAIFQDDTLITLGENSRLEIDEHVYDPKADTRSTVMRLVKGSVRSLVGRVFVGLGSKFEVHTPTAVAAARGTYFVVWIEEEKPVEVGLAEARNPYLRPVSLAGSELAQLKLPPGTTGIANIGKAGTVNFTAGGTTVNVQPGQFTLATPGGPPRPPVVFTPAAPGGATANNAIKSTDVKESAKQESPKETVKSTGGTAPAAPQINPQAGPTNAPGAGTQTAGKTGGGESSQQSGQQSSQQSGQSSQQGGQGGQQGGTAQGPGQGGASGGSGPGGGQQLASSGGPAAGPGDPGIKAGGGDGSTAQGPGGQPGGQSGGTAPGPGTGQQLASTSGSGGGSIGGPTGSTTGGTLSSPAAPGGAGFNAPGPTAPAPTSLPSASFGGGTFGGGTFGNFTGGGVTPGGAIGGAITAPAPPPAGITFTQAGPGGVPQSSLPGVIPQAKTPLTITIKVQ